MSTNLTENVVDPSNPLEAPKAVAARPAPKSDRYWFVFDRWLPMAPAPEDEFVLG